MTGAYSRRAARQPTAPTEAEIQAGQDKLGSLLAYVADLEASRYIWPSLQAMREKHGLAALTWWLGPLSAARGSALEGAGAEPPKNPTPSLDEDLADIPHGDAIVIAGELREKLPALARTMTHPGKLVSTFRCREAADLAGFAVFVVHASPKRADYLRRAIAAELEAVQ
jgi:hypothetical protein